VAAHIFYLDHEKEEAEKRRRRKRSNYRREVGRQVRKWEEGLGEDANLKSIVPQGYGLL
jgi:hypothetical protein